MNEPLYQNQDLIGKFMNVTEKLDEEYVRKNSVVYVTDKTADLSKHQHYASLNSEAQYPFDYHNAVQKWKDNKVLFDQNDGAIGNSIYFKQGGLMSARIAKTLFDEMQRRQRFSLALWVQSNDLSSETKIFEIPGNLSVTINNDGNVTAAIPGSNLIAATALQLNKWHHLAVVYNFRKLSIYVNGQLATSTIAMPLAFQGFKDNKLALQIGPNGVAVKDSLTKIDEVYFYSAALSANEVRNLAWRSSEVSSYSVNSQLASIGKLLFDSTKLSGNNMISCSTCHMAGKGFSDGLTLAKGINDQSGQFNTPTLLNAANNQYYFFNGKAVSLEEQVMHPIFDSKEMGMNNPKDMLLQLPQDLSEKLKKHFGSAPQLSHISQALAAYIRTLKTKELAEPAPLIASASAIRGKFIFEGKANCVACHQGQNLSDNSFHDVGIGSHSGRQSVTLRTSDFLKVKTPTLWNLANTAPYFHDGSKANLRQVVEHYNTGARRTESGKSLSTSRHLVPLELKNSEINDLVEYLESLKGTIQEEP